MIMAIKSNIAATLVEEDEAIFFSFLFFSFSKWMEMETEELIDAI